MKIGSASAIVAARAGELSIAAVTTSTWAAETCPSRSAAPMHRQVGELAGGADLAASRTGREVQPVAHPGGGRGRAVEGGVPGRVEHGGRGQDLGVEAALQHDQLGQDLTAGTGRQLDEVDAGECVEGSVDRGDRRARPADLLTAPKPCPRNG